MPVGAAQDLPDRHVGGFGELFQIPDVLGTAGDLPGVAGLYTQEDLYECGLPGPVHADQSDGVVLVDLDIGVDEYFVGPEGLGD